MCEYDIEPNVSRKGALKKKNVSLQEDMGRMLELYEYIRTRPAPEVEEIVRRIRANADPFAVLRFIQDGDLLLQRPLSSPRAKLGKLPFDTSATRNYIRVPARPWTAVAGDELVSELIDTCLNRDGAFILPYIDKDILVAEMISGSTEDAKFCSPALVNALCSLGAVSASAVLPRRIRRTDSSQFTSSYALAVDAAVGGSIRRKFYDEARKLLDNEAGKPSLPSAQAMLTLYMYSTANAMDRAGYMYRMLACEMFRRLQLGTESVLARNTYGSTAGKALSRNAWGFFCLER